MFRILDKDQPVVVSSRNEFHSQGVGACESSWSLYWSNDTLKEAQVGGSRACENCSFEAVKVGKLLRQLLKL